MYNEGKLCIVKSCVPTQDSGSKIVRQSEGMVDVVELHNLLKNPDNVVVIVNDTYGSDTTIQQVLHLQERLQPQKVNEEECDTFTFAMYGHTTSAIVNRKIIMAFSYTLSDEPCIMCTYYKS